MRERPIVFSAPMVLALLDGRKTQTRRVMKSQPVTGYLGPVGEHFVFAPSEMFGGQFHCPYGKPGDRLWVKETWTGTWHPTRQSNTNIHIAYAADGSDGWRQAPADYVLPKAAAKPGGWVTPLFMPRWASRITLEITEVRVQRLQDISDEDAAAEGITARDFYLWTLDLAAKENTENLCWIETPDGSSDEDYCQSCADKKLAEIVAERGNSVDCFVDGRWNGYEADGPRFCETCGVTLEVCYTDYAVEEELTHFKTHNPGPTAAYELNRLAAAIFEEDHERQFAKIGYRWLWESIHGAGSWDANPWVWALTFTRLANA